MDVLLFQATSVYCSKPTTIIYWQLLMQSTKGTQSKTEAVPKLSQRT